MWGEGYMECVGGTQRLQHAPTSPLAPAHHRLVGPTATPRWGWGYPSGQQVIQLRFQGSSAAAILCGMCPDRGNEVPLGLRLRDCATLPSNFWRQCVPF